MSKPPNVYVHSPRLRDMLTWSFKTTLVGLIAVGLFACTAPFQAQGNDVVRSGVTSQNVAGVKDEGTGFVNSCGPVTPTYHYFSEISPKLEYPKNYAISLDEFYTYENLNKYIEGFHELPRVNSFPYILTALLEGHFTNEELLCWSDMGDQVAQISVTSDSVKTFFSSIAYMGIESSWDHRNYDLPDELIQERAMEISKNINLNELRLDIQMLSRAASVVEVDCKPTDNPDAFKNSDCHPKNTLRIYPLGQPSAHFALSYIYYAGPRDVRSPKLAEKHLIFAALLGHGVAYKHNPYECEHADVYHENPLLEERMWNVLNIDKHINDVTREKYKSALLNCL